MRSEARDAEAEALPGSSCSLSLPMLQLHADSDDDASALPLTCRSSAEAALFEERWTKPEPRFLKLNVDASFIAESGTGATGAILHDYQERFVATSVTFLPHVMTTSMAKALAMKEGIILADRFGRNRI
ncbi:hypothetical protein QYE76_011974 [Lolium multiflorum]|uniref:RNase H type-1 domain-containing protein n=1 Tax=Lolium multiflorum TaxID=4521 RepID=A0AAD8U041_LOLMU|nr:hypothetical protein QYE76_011974 [Lolium multiflorum]